MIGGFSLHQLLWPYPTRIWAVQKPQGRRNLIPAPLCLNPLILRHSFDPLFFPFFQRAHWLSLEGRRLFLDSEIDSFEFGDTC
jgi:hypothetical protein